MYTCCSRSRIQMYSLLVMNVFASFSFACNRLFGIRSIAFTSFFFQPDLPYQSALFPSVIIILSNTFFRSSRWFFLSLRFLEKITSKPENILKKICGLQQFELFQTSQIRFFFLARPMFANPIEFSHRSNARVTRISHTPLNI